MSTRLVAVVGMGLTLPGASTPDEFWQLLHRQNPVFCEPGTFDIDSFWSADPDAEDRMYVRRSGYIHDFRPHPAIAAEIADGRTLPTPATWLRHALLYALDGVTMNAEDRFAFVPALTVDGCRHCEESAILEQLTALAGEHGDTARDVLRPHLPYAVADPDHVLPCRQARAALAGVLPDDTDLLIADAACASSLYTVDIGARRILDGTADLAVCGGAFMLTPRYNVGFAKLRGLSRGEEARCFDRDADGVILGEGAGLVALKELGRARADGDRVLGVLLGFGGASDGRGKALAAPNPHGQQRAITRARAVRDIVPADVDWILAHATGTVLGDRTELQALTATGDPDRPPLATSNKSLVGHTITAAGIISFIHTLLGLQHGHVPPQRRYTALPDTRAAVTVPTTATPLRSGSGGVAGVSAFGFGGINSHQLITRDRPGLTGRCTPNPSDDDITIAEWGAHLPGSPPRADIQRWLRTDEPYPWATSFGDAYPAPPFSDLPIPPPTLAAMDRTQPMAISAVASLVAQLGDIPDQLRETTGVVVGHTGYARRSGEAALRTYRHHLERALPEIRAISGHAVADAIADALDTGCEAMPPINEDTVAGTLPNVIAGRVANRFDLRGLNLTVDAADNAFLAALRTARDYLRDGYLDACLVIGVSGNATTWGSRFTEVSGQIAEGAFAIALTRQCVARSNSFPILAKLGVTDPGTIQEPRADHADPAFPGCNAAIPLLRAIERTTEFITLRPPPDDDARFTLTISTKGQ